MTVPLVGAGSGTDVQRTLASVLTANGIRAIAREYSHAPVPPGIDLAVEYDGSVVGESKWAGIQWFPVELKTRVLNGIDDWEAICPKTLEIARYMGGRVNLSCGHHLHLGFDECKQDPRTVRSLWNLFHRYDQVLFGLVAPSRRHSNFCRPMPSITKLLHGAHSRLTIRRALSSYDRYAALNLVNLFADEPHLEIRHHGGTLDLIKARYWLRFCLRLVDHAVQRSCQAAPAPLPNDRKSLEKLLITCGLKINSRVYAQVAPELRETGKYVLKTWKKFNGPRSLKDARKAEDREEEAACAG